MDDRDRQENDDPNATKLVIESFSPIRPFAATDLTDKTLPKITLSKTLFDLLLRYDFDPTTLKLEPSLQ
jgi:hypothetical protein